VTARCCGLLLHPTKSRPFEWETPSIYRQKLLDKPFSLQYGKNSFLERIFLFPIGRWDLFYCPVPSYLNKTGVFWIIAARSRLLKAGARMIFVRPVLICLLTEIRVDRI